MFAVTESSQKRKMHRDNWLSVLLGPLKFIVPTISYLILYPLIISETNIEVLGVWSLIASIVSFMGVTDIGFSQLLTRNAGRDREQHQDEIYADYITAKRTYIVILFLIIATFAVTNKSLLTPLESVYPISSLYLSVILLLLGTFIQLSAKLDAAILMARHDNYFVQVVTSITPILTYSAAIIGTLYKRPIEGFALGTMLAGVANLYSYKLRLKHRHSDFSFARLAINLSNTVKTLFSLIERGWHLYSCSIGMLTRGPIFRFVIASTIGLQAVAIFDISMRITQTVREVIATGFSVLFPSFSLLSRQGDRERTIELIQVSLLVLLSAGALSLGVLIVSTDILLSLWLGNYSPELASTTRILAAWQMLTIANVPFWHLLYATNNEKVAAYSIWIHTAAILLAIPFSYTFTISIPQLAVYWTVTSVITQSLIYYHAQSRLGILWEAILDLRIISLFSLATIYLVFSYIEASSNIDSAVYFAISTGLFLSVAYVIVAMPIYRYVKTGSISIMTIGNR